MADDDKTAALVVALSAQLTKFESDMKRAGDVADRTVSGIEDRFSKSNPSFAGSFLGNFFSNLTTKGLDAAVKLVSDLVDRFIDLDKVSKLVGESMRDLFGVQQAASEFKVPVDDATASIKNLGVLLDQLQRGETNSLSKLFEANPIALKGVNQDALTLQQTFAIVADLVSNARTEIQKVDLTKAAGQTETMVRFLEQGGEAVTYLSKNAAATAPDLQKLADSAKAFDDAWRSAVSNVKAYLSEHLFDIIKTDLQDIIALLGGAVKFLSLFKGGLIDSSTQSAAADLDKFRQSLVNFKSAREQIDESAGLDTSKSARNDRSAEPPGPRQAGTSTADPSRPLSNVPVSKQPKEAQDSFDRTEESITRHTATINADTIAVSQNNAVQAQLRAEFQLLNAIRKDEGEVTQAQIDQYEKLRATMSAEQALEQAHINLSPAHKASFISASEGAKEATANFDAARESLNKINSASSQIGSALSSAFADAVVEGKSLNEVFSSLVKTLEKAAINSVFASIFNAPSSGGLSPFASLFKGVIPGFASGTNYAPGGSAWVGENGPEIVNLPRGAQVVPSAVATKGSGGVTVNLIEDSSRAGQTQKQDNNNGGMDLAIFVDAITAKNTANPGSATSAALDSRRRVASR
jgi:hypothetical protein